MTEEPGWTGNIGLWLWGAAVLTYGIGDVATTIPGLHLGAREASELPARFLTQYGALGFIAMKTSVFLFLIVLAKGVDRMPIQRTRLVRLMVPALTATFGVATIVNNVVVLIAVMQ